MHEQALLAERAKLIERNKELACLYGIAKIVANTETTFAEVVQAIVDVLPSAFHRPDQVSARIVVDGQVFQTARFAESGHALHAPLLIDGQPRGALEVFSRWHPDAADAPKACFLPEERKLLQAIVGQVSLMIGIGLANERRSQLERQLRHADRLAKVGQLTAGVAHELNEPLASILGFAQLAAKKIGTPDQAGRYLDKIIQACLHAREVIRKMMLFSSPAGQRMSRIDLNRVLAEAMSFIEPRFARTAIRFETVLAGDLPPILADASQITQVITNLVLNAIHALGEGGTITLRTESGHGGARMIVADTGVGMDAATLEQIFLPFFTTKDVDQGTGLGLSVVHGIVTAHGGTIDVQSSVGRGTTCTITFPRCDGAGEDREDTNGKINDIRREEIGPGQDR